VQPNPHTDWVLVLRGVRIRVRRVLPNSFPALPTTKRKQQSNPPKLITHSTKASFDPKREARKETPKSREEAFIYMFCGRAGHLDEFCFRHKKIERRHDEYARNSYRDEFIDFPPRSYSHLPPRFYSRALRRTSARDFPQFSYGPNYRSYGLGSRENRFVPRCFGYGPRPCHGDHFPCRPDFPTGGAHTHFELRHLDGPHFSRRGLRPTQLNGELQRIVKTPSGRMVKC
jgi:hypothetical protein